MFSTFSVYLELGFEHIADLAAFDHILFVVALSAGYALSQWRQLLVLVTAFTVGHSVTLALATLRLVTVSTALVEFLIPVTIVATAVYTGFEAWAGGETGVEDGAARAATAADSGSSARLRHVKYAMALAFGLIHGLGFSNFLRAILGGEESITLPLFAFNVGLEIGQIAILGIALLASWGVLRVTPAGHRAWTLILCSVTSIVALALLAGRLP